MILILWHSTYRKGGENRENKQNLKEGTILRLLDKIELVDESGRILGPVSGNDVEK